MTSALGGVGETVGKAAKGVPPIVWIVVVAGGLGVSVLLSRKGSSSKTTTEDPVPSGALIYTGVGGAGTGADSTGDSTTSTVGAPTTNETWAMRAKTYLISQGKDPSVATSAVDKYLAAQALTAQEQAMISIALTAVGPTPLPLPPTSGTPVDTNDPYTSFSQRHVSYQKKADGTASTNGSVYTVQAGDTVWSIAKTAYGIGDANAYTAIAYAAEQILNANWQKLPDMRNPAPGTTLYIPLITSQDFPRSQYAKFSAKDWAAQAGFLPASVVQQ